MTDGISASTITAVILRRGQATFTEIADDLGVSRDNPELVAVLKTMIRSEFLRTSGRAVVLADPSVYADVAVAVAAGPGQELVLPALDVLGSPDRLDVPGWNTFLDGPADAPEPARTLTEREQEHRDRIRTMEEEVIAKAKALDPADQSPDAEYLRGVAGDLFEQHRQTARREVLAAAKRLGIAPDTEPTDETLASLNLTTLDYFRMQGEFLAGLADRVDANDLHIADARALAEGGQGIISLIVGDSEPEGDWSRDDMMRSDDEPREDRDWEAEAGSHVHGPYLMPEPVTTRRGTVLSYHPDDDGGQAYIHRGDHREQAAPGSVEAVSAQLYYMVQAIRDREDHGVTREQAIALLHQVRTVDELERIAGDFGQIPGIRRKADLVRFIAEKTVAAQLARVTLRPGREHYRPVR